MLAGEPLGDVPDDDLRFAVDLGLVRMSSESGVTTLPTRFIAESSCVRSPAVRALHCPQIPTTWLKPDGRLDERRLLEAFLAFWRQHGEPLLGAAPRAARSRRTSF